jgi:gamma-glutamylputrescine oxidase
MRRRDGQEGLDRKRPLARYRPRMKNDSISYYSKSAGPAPARLRFAGDVVTDVCVIGGGYTGLSAALHLAEAGARVAVVEAETIGFAASGRNGGQIHTGWRIDQRSLERKLGEAHARDLWNLCEESKALLRERVANYHIDCELKDGLIHGAHNARAAAILADDAEYLRLHYNYTQTRMMNADETAAQTGTPIYKGGSFDAGGGHLHPLKYARGLADAAEVSGATIYEHSPARAVSSARGKVRVQCESGIVLADYALLACDAFTGALAPSLSKYIGHLESYIVATAPLPQALYRAIIPSDAAVADTRHVLDYYRKSADGRLLFGGRETYFFPPPDVATLVRPRMLQVFPALADTPIEYGWHGTVGITATRMPHLGRISDRIFFAYGYSGQGVALAGLGGKLMAEAALGRPERFDVVARVKPEAFPGGKMLRKPLVNAALFGFKILDMF